MKLHSVKNHFHVDPDDNWVVFNRGSEKIAYSCVDRNEAEDYKYNSNQHSFECGGEPDLYVVRHIVRLKCIRNYVPGMMFMEQQVYLCLESEWSNGGMVIDKSGHLRAITFDNLSIITRNGDDISRGIRDTKRAYFERVDAA